MMCRLLEVSKSGYYKWLRAAPSRRAERRERLAVRIKEIHEQEHRIPGQRKIRESLRRSGEECSLGLVRRICREFGIYSLTLKRKRSKPLTTDSKHSNHVCKNILNRDFVTTGPNEKWLTDITYIKIKGKFVYLSAIIDLHSRRVISWIISHDMKTRLVVDTLKRALKTRRGIVPKQIIFHSDRGIQYTSKEFRQELERFGITQSMSGKGECWDNAPCESFWGKLKREWLNHYGTFESIEQVRLAVFEYIEGYYYNQRLHEGLGYRTPREVEEEYFGVR